MQVRRSDRLRALADLIDSLTPDTAEAFHDFSQALPPQLQFEALSEAYRRFPDLIDRDDFGDWALRLSRITQATIDYWSAEFRRNRRVHG